MDEKTPIEEIMEENRKASLNAEDEELLKMLAAAMKKKQAERIVADAQENDNRADEVLLTAFANGKKQRSQIALNISANENMQITIGNDKRVWLDHYVGDVASVATAGFIILGGILNICGLL